MFRRRLPHQRALGAIPVAPRTHDHQQPAHHMRPERLDRRLHSPRRVRIIHENRRAVHPPRRQLHPPPHGLHPRQRVEHLIGVRAGTNRQPGGQKHVLRLEPADQAKLRLPHAAMPLEPQHLPRRRETPCDDMQIGAIPAPHAQHFLPARPRDRRHVPAPLVIDIDDSHAILRQNPREQPRLGREIFIKISVIVEVILRQVGKPRRRDPDPVQPPLRQPVARRLHRRMGHPRGLALGQNPVQSNGLGRRMLQRHLVGALDARRADAHRLEPQRRPDLPRKARHGGLAVRPRDGHHRLGLRPEPQRRAIGQRLPRVFRHDQRGLALGQLRLGNPRAVGIRQDRPGAHPQRVLDELAPMHARARQRSEKEPLPHLATVHRKPGDLGFPAALRGQAKLCQ